MLFDLSPAWLLTRFRGGLGYEENRLVTFARTSFENH
jgi:hypothetical protein